MLGKGAITPFVRIRRYGPNRHALRTGLRFSKRENGHRRMFFEIYGRHRTHPLYGIDNSIIFRGAIRPKSVLSERRGRLRPRLDTPTATDHNPQVTRSEAATSRQ